MTLDAQTLGVVDTDILTSERPAAPTFHLHPNVDAAPPPHTAPPIEEASANAHPAGPGAATTALLSPIGDTSPSKPSARRNSVADHSANASEGSAQIRHDAQGSYGAPTLSDSAFEVPIPDLRIAESGAGQSGNVALASDAGATLSEPASRSTSPDEELQARRGGHKTSGAQLLSAPAKRSSRAKAVAPTNDALPGSGDDLSRPETQSRNVVATPSDPANHPVDAIVHPQDRGDGHIPLEGQAPNAVATIVDLWRQRVDLRRAEGRLNLQALATIRRSLGGDKEAAQKAWGAIQKGRDADAALAMVVEPYRQAMAVLDGSAKGLEKQLCKMVRPLALWTWAADVRGLGELSIAGLIGEAAGLPGQYKSVSAVWKRFGLAVIEGGRQRRVADAQAALIHGYAPQRRAFAYVLSTQLMRSQREGDPYRAIYDRRKAYELEREIPKAHAHNRALRYMVKELLKRAYLADRRGGA